MTVLDIALEKNRRDTVNGARSKKGMIGYHERVSQVFRRWTAQMRENRVHNVRRRKKVFSHSPCLHRTLTSSGYGDPSWRGRNDGKKNRQHGALTRAPRILDSSEIFHTMKLMRLYGYMYILIKR